MFRLVFIITVINSLLIPFSWASSTHSVEGGTMHFYGAVVGASCAIDAQSMEQAIVLDQITASTLTGPGSWSGATPFWIKLQQCDATTTQFVRVAFIGQADENDPQVFKASYGSDGVKGVGIGIFDEAGELVIPNSAPKTKSPVSAGQNIMFFTAKYRATSSHVVPGKATAAVNFSVIYQ